MFPAKRMEIITKMLDENGCIDVNTIADLTGVTPKTIRQDLIKMEKIGVLERVHGGAVLKKEDTIFPVSQRKQKHMEEKSEIAKLAVSLIEDGDSIILDAGTTCLELAKRIEKQKIIVITNDPFIAYELLHKDNVTLYLLGGKLERDEGSYTFCGSDAITSLGKYKATKCFLGTSALDFNKGLMVFSGEQAEIKKEMIKSAGQIICLVDYSKFHKIAFVTFAKLNDLDIVITDNSILPEDVEFLRSQNIKVVF